MRSEKEKMLAGQLYRADDPELVRDYAAARAWMDRYNGSGLTGKERAAMLREGLGHVGKNVVVRALGAYFDLKRVRQPIEAALLGGAREAR